MFFFSPFFFFFNPFTLGRGGIADPCRLAACKIPYAILVRVCMYISVCLRVCMCVYTYVMYVIMLARGSLVSSIPSLSTEQHITEETVHGLFYMPAPASAVPLGGLIWALWVLGDH
ncbi:hypothetical protein F4823DRAFT_616107 [Ustulina deusta]|nr:hypothetical protein F4823DRAFT_616107 [Ustulina deusta]